MNHDHHQLQATDKNGSHESCESCKTNMKKSTDWLLWISVVLIVLGYIAQLFSLAEPYPFLFLFTQTVYELMNKMWWGVLLGILSVGVLGTIPRELIIGMLGKGGTFSGIVRATFGGVLLDLCSHGILLVGMKLYERGASLGQTMAFLIASPWNSVSLTLILWALVGFKWMMAVLVLSLIVAIISGVVFDRLVARGVLPANPHHTDLPEGFSFWTALRTHFQSVRWTPTSLVAVLWNGLKESEMVLRWIFFGVILAAGIRTFFSPDMFSLLFGPTLLGLGSTLLFATILEVCSEGSMPIASDILLRASAPGNAFAFLMVGVSTDYTEILALKETTKSWKISLFLPLVTLPQVVLIALILNRIGL